MDIWKISVSRCLLPFILLAWLGTGCRQPIAEDSVGSDKLTAIDSRGVQIILQQPARRIVVLSQGGLDGLYMLGAKNAIVGIQASIYTNPDTFHYFGLLDERIAAREIASPGHWGHSTNLESVVRLNPDLVILESSQTDQITILEKMNFNVFAIEGRNNESMFTELINLGILTGTQPRAEELIKYTRDQFSDIVRFTSQFEKKKSIYYAWSGGRVYSTSGRGGRIGQAMDLAGVENACPFDVDVPNVNPENLVVWNPDVILLWNSDPDLLWAKKELSSLKAIQDKQILKLNPSFFYDPHTLKIVLLARELNQFCYAAADEDDLLMIRKETMQMLYGDDSHKFFL